MSKKSKRQQTNDAPAATLGISSRWCWFLLGVVILFFSLIRVRLLNMPLERDEGEYAYAGQLMLQGIAPYQLAYNMKLPGTYGAYALIMAIFGQSPAGIHAGLLLVNAATVVLLFLLGKRMFGPLGGLAAGSSYAVLSTSEAVLGFAAHATHFVVLSALGGTLLLLDAMQNNRMRLFFASGFLLGLAFVLKQPGLFFVLFGGFFLIASEWRAARDWRGLARRVAVYSTGAAAPFALICLILFFAGALGKMWFWTFSYASQYASILSPVEGLQNFWYFAPAVVLPCLPLWIVAGIGMAALAWDSRTWRHGIFLTSFLLFSWAAVCPGLYFRQHYFVLVLPAVCLLVGVAMSSAAHQLSELFGNSAAVASIPLLALFAVIAVSVAGQREVLFQLDPVAASRHAYGNSPFPEAQTISEYLRRETGEDTRIAVMGSEPEIYFYSRRHSATGYIYMYPLMENQKYALDMQKEMANEIESNPPEYIVVVNVSTSWMPGPDSNGFIFDWFRKYLSDQYEIVGVADEVAPETRYVWGDAAKSYRVQSDASVQVFKRGKI
jgi:4-amino-4-deoxy-L-arabinose transferase-like glycosyltransferase